MASTERPFGPGGEEETALEIEQLPANGQVPTDLLEVIESGSFETEDGGIEFGQEEVIQEMNTVPFDANLADYMEEDQLQNISNDLLGGIEEDKSSRKGWEEAYEKGIKLLGTLDSERSEPFEGASNVIHPMLAESATKFQAMAYKELLPPGGPVRTMIMGDSNPEVDAQADRVQEFMNYQITYEMEEYDPEMDQLLYYLPLSGSAFKKVYYDPTMARPCARFVHAEKLIVPYNTTDLVSASRITHQLSMNGNDVRKMQLSGVYKDVDLQSGGYVSTSDVEEEIARQEGIERTSFDNDVFELYEVHTLLDLEGFEDSSNGEVTGIKVPYIVTLDAVNGKVLSIRRNYAESDPLKKPRQYFVHYKFLPGLGFYGFGLPHIIGGVSRSATSILRQLIDAGTLANLPAGFKARGIRIRDDDVPLQPGEFRDVDAPGGSLQNSLIPLPFKEPSGTLFNLLKLLEDSGKNFAAIADHPYQQMDKNAPVGTTLANLEHGTRVMSAIHKRLHYAQKVEFKLLGVLFRDYLPPSYPYMVNNGQSEVKQTDFDDRVDILPVSDPNIHSLAQRIAVAQTELQIVQSNPQIHGPTGLWEAYRRMYEAIGVKNVEQILPPPQQPQPTDPALENAAALQGGQLQAFAPQDHDAHIKAHTAALATPTIATNPQVASALQAHIYQHFSFKAKAMALAELQNSAEYQQLMQQSGGQIPPEQQQALQEKLEEEAALDIAEMTELFTQTVEQDLQIDPLVQLRQKELELKEMDQERKGQEFQQRLLHDIRSDDADIQVDKERLRLQEKNIDERTEIAQERIDVQREKQQ